MDPEVAVWIAEGDVSHTPGAVDRAIGERDSTLGKLGGASVHIGHAHRQLKARSKAGLSEGHFPQQLFLGLGAAEKTQKDVVKFEDDRALFLVGRCDLEDTS